VLGSHVAVVLRVAVVVENGCDAFSLRLPKYAPILCSHVLPVLDKTRLFGNLSVQELGAVIEVLRMPVDRAGWNCLCMSIDMLDQLSSGTLVPDTRVDKQVVKINDFVYGGCGWMRIPVNESHRLVSSTLDGDRTVDADPVVQESREGGLGHFFGYAAFVEHVVLLPHATPCGFVIPLHWTDFACHVVDGVMV
jgi:hypothetical protein